MNENRFTFVLLCIALSLMPMRAIAQNEHSSEKDVEVMILGVTHLTGGGQDVVNNPNIKNYLAPEGQEEIKQVLDRLAGFAPDKIMIELDFEDEDKFNRKLQVIFARRTRISGQ